MVTSILSCTQITFEGIRGTDYTGDIAIDDVSITAGICQGTSGSKLAWFSECILILNIYSLNFRFVLPSLPSVEMYFHNKNCKPDLFMEITENHMY